MHGVAAQHREDEDGCWTALFVACLWLLLKVARP